MTAERQSFQKTVSLAIVIGAGACAVVWITVAHWSGLSVAVVAGVGGALALAALLVAAGGLIVISRDAAQSRGEGDAFVPYNRTRPERHLAQARFVPGLMLRLLRRIGLADVLLVGDRVEVRSLAEIRATLDADGALDGLPFMVEMARFAGRSAIVFRCVDKIYDYGRSRRLQRIDDTVLLGGFRCDGEAHGNCEAACYLH